MERRELFLCNTVYQVMVALWIKRRLRPELPADILISDHMNGAEQIAGRLGKTGVFERCFFARTLDEARYRVARNAVEARLANLFPQRLLRRYVPLPERYTDLYLANLDPFSQLLFHALSRRCRNLRLHLFEDGLSTYRDMEGIYRSFASFYYDPAQDQNALRRFLHRHIYHLRPLYGNLGELLLFNPSLLRWDPGCPVTAMDKIDPGDSAFRALVNEVFAYAQCRDRYEQPYLFFEESFYADGEEIDDVALVEKLAARLGRDKLLIKRHPRNPEDRFAPLGYQSNRDTAIPWELILMNLGDVSDKVFFTVSSCAAVNPMLLFGQKVKVYVLYPCLEHPPRRLRGEAWDFVESVFRLFPDTVTICRDLDRIEL